MNTTASQKTVLFSDEALFYVNGEVNRQNVRYWSQNNLRWMDPSKQQGAERIMVWCGLWKAHVLEPFFFDRSITGETYLALLGNQLRPQLDGLGEGLPEWFQQDGAPAHCATVVRHWLDDNFPNWIGRCGRVEWAPCSPLDFFFWGMLKEKVYSMKITDINHLKEHTINECAKIDGNTELLHRVHVNLVKRVELCIANDGHHVEDVIE
jgi:hypothetical protein